MTTGRTEAAGPFGDPDGAGGILRPEPGTWENSSPGSTDGVHRGPDRKGVPISEVADPLDAPGEPDPPSGGPRAPWVVVVGMHRSGTSVLTGVLGGLGLTLPRPDDRWEPLPSNPEHFESRSMVTFDDDLLAELGGSWDGPPHLAPGWEEHPELLAFDDHARAVAGEAYPGSGPAVWKDPRSCLLLPYWRRLLPQPLLAVLMWRDPREVARSLRQRDGFSLALGAALWEHYNRAALHALEGVQVFVMSYDELLGDPVGLCRSLGDWLDSLDPLDSWRGSWDRAGAAASVTESLRHQHTGPEQALLDSQVALVDQLRGLHGPHRALPAVRLGPPSPWASALLEEHRELVLLGRRVEVLEEAAMRAEESALRAELAEQAAANLRSTTSWQLTRPLRQLSSRLMPRRDTQ